MNRVGSCWCQASTHCAMLNYDHTAPIPAKHLSNLGRGFPEARADNPTLRNINVQILARIQLCKAEFSPACIRVHTKIERSIEGSVGMATVTKRHPHLDIAVRPDPHYLDLEVHESLAITHNHLLACLVDVLEALQDLRVPIDFIATDIASPDSR